MPVSIDARPPGLNLTFLRGTARNQPILFPAGTLAGRTFTATLDGVGLSVGIVGDTLTVSVTVAQTNAAANGPLPFVLTETTGVDQPYVIGTWRASTRPSAVTPSSPVTLVVNNETVTLQPISGTEFPELVAGDPAELGLVTTGGVTTAILLGTMARTALHGAGQYYLNYSHSLSGTQTMTQDTLRLYRTYLSAGTIDRIGAEVVTAVASLVLRFGIYTENAGLPFARIAEASSTADASTTGTKDLTISAVIPKPGAYWLAVVSQGATGGALRQPSATPPQILPMPLGTVAPSGANSYSSRRQTGVTGALPATLSAIDDAPGVNIAIHYRYSSISP